MNMQTIDPNVIASGFSSTNNNHDVNMIGG